MKKTIYLLFLIFLLVGCGNKQETISEVEYNYNRSFYKVYEPYKSYIDNNYLMGKTFNRYDLREVEMGLMRISTRYFSPDKYYYQAGQYLTEEDLTSLLSVKKLNKKDDTLNYQPQYVSYIHEQDYLNMKGELKGISLGLVLNPYQVFTVDGKTIKETIDRDNLIKIGQDRAKDLLDYVRLELKLKDIEILIGLYIQTEPSSMVPGSYACETFIKYDTIKKFNNLNEQYYLLTDSYLRTIDMNTYEDFNSLKNKMQSSTNVIAMMGRGLYVNNQLQEVTIDINVNYMAIGEINSLSQVIAQEIATLFKNNIIIEVVIKNESKIEAIISKDIEQNKSKIFFIN